MNPGEESYFNSDKDKSSEAETLYQEYLSRIESGEDLNPEEYLRRYPELEEELRQHFAKMNDGKAKAEAEGEDRILGDYRLIRKIGEGGMGEVYEAEQLSLKRKVALKLLPSHLNISDTAVKKFQREAEAGGRQSHPGIVAIYAVGKHEQIHFIAQELVEGGRTLADQLEELRNEDELPVGYYKDVAGLLSQVADALQHTHDSNVIHRDIKPSNILLDKDGNPKVTDFGLAKVEDALELSRTGDWAGTPYYMSPEQILTRRIGIDHRTDIYSLGVTLYEMLTLKRPFEGKTSHEVLKRIMWVDPVDPQKTNTRVPRDLGTICLKAMEKLPEQRYQSMRALGEDLNRFLHGDVILAKPARFGTRIWKRAKRNPALSAAVVITLAALLTLGIFIPWQWYQKKEAEKNREALIKEREMSEKLRSLYDGSRLVAQSSSLVSSNPGLALLLAIKSAELHPGLLANNALVDAMVHNREQLTLQGRENEFGTAIFSPDGDKIAVESWHRTVSIWEAETGKEIADLKGSTPSFSPDGLKMATASWGSAYVYNATAQREERSSEDRLARIWNTCTGEEVAVLNGHDKYVYTATFNPDGSKVVTASADDTARIWNAVNGDEIIKLKGHEEDVLSAFFTPDGNRVVTESKNKKIRFWNVSSGDTIFEINGQLGDINLPLFSSDGDRIVTFLGRAAWIWNTETGDQITSFSGNTDEIEEACISPKGNKVVFTFSDGTASIWDASRGKEIQKLIKPGVDVQAACFCPDGLRVLTTGRNQSASIWDIFTGKEIAQFLGHGDELNTAYFNHDGRQVITSSEDGTVRIWDGATSVQRKQDTEKPVQVMLGRFSPDGARLVTTSEEDIARTWDVKNGRQLFTLEGHDGRVVTTDFSPDGKRIVTSSADGTARIWDARSGEEVAECRGHSDMVVLAGFSSDSRRIVTASMDKTARIWEADTGKELRCLEGHENAVLCAGFSPNGKWVVTGSADRTVRIWNAETGDKRHVLKGHEQPVFAACFHPDEHQLVTVSWLDSTTRVWNGETGAQKAVFPGGSGNLLHMTMDHSINGESLVTTSITRNDHSARIWDLRNPEKPTLLHGHESPVATANFSMDGRWIVTGSTDGMGRIWDASTGEVLKELKGHSSSIIASGFSPDGKKILTVTRDRKAWIWDAATGKVVHRLTNPDNGSATARESLAPEKVGAEVETGSYSRRGIPILSGHQEAVYRATFSPDGKQLVTASEDGTARLWDASSGVEIARWEGHSGPVVTAKYSPDGLRVVTTSKDETARLWDVMKGEQIRKLGGRDGAILNASFSFDGKKLVTSGGFIDAWPKMQIFECRTVQIWDGRSGDELRTLEGHEKTVLTAQFSSDAKRVITGSKDGTARIWNAETGKEILRLEGHNGGVYVVLFQPDGQKVFTAGHYRAHIWDALTGRQLATIKPHRIPILRAAFSPDGKRVVTSTWGGSETRIWDVDTGFETMAISGHGGSVFSVAFSPDGKRIVTTSEDKTARLWDAYTGEEIATYKGHEDWVLSGLFSPDGLSVVTTSRDGTARLWPLDLLSAAKKAKPRELTFEDKKNYSIWTRQECEALAFVDTLFDELEFSIDVIAQLEGDASLDESFRETALRFAQTKKGKTFREMANDYSELSRSIVLRPEAKPKAYVKAHRYADVAYRMYPEDGGYLTTLGIAQYRMGRFEEAQTTLGRVNNIKKKSPSLVAFQAMCHHQLGHESEAKNDFEELLKLMQDQKLSKWPENQYALNEAEELIIGPHMGQARELVDKLIKEVVMVKEAKNRFASLESIPERVRRTALDMLNDRKDDPADLNTRSWEVVRSSDRSLEEYNRALRWAEGAAGLKPDEGLILNTLGVAQYRAGKYEEALDTLARADDKNGGIPSDIAFIAMAYSRLGHAAEAEAALKRLRTVMHQNPRMYSDKENHLFLQEAVTLIE